jgi:hypothetical protein
MSDFHTAYKQQLLTAADALFGAQGASQARARMPRRRRLPVLVAIALGVLLLAAAAFAADRIIGVGAPVKPSNGPVRSSLSTGVGIPVPGSRSRQRSASLLPISVPDPGGGLPWGMRIVTTTRGLVCVQIGRLLDGHLGVLGQDGAFANDGLFHELPPGALDQSTCTGPENIALYAAPGLPAAGALPGVVRSCSGTGSPRTEPAESVACPARDERLIAFGLLGPHAVDVSYKTASGPRTVATSGSHGAYLIVLARGQRQTPENGELYGATYTPMERLPVATKGYLLSTIVFGFGNRRCQAGAEHQPGGPPACGVSGIAPPAFATPLGSHLHSRVTLAARRVAGSYDLDLTFVAPAAVRDAATAYGAEYDLPGSRTCKAQGGGQPIERDIGQGAVVHVTLSVSQQPACHGVVRGRIVLGRQSSPLSGPAYDERTIGRFAFALP